MSAYPCGEEDVFADGEDVEGLPQLALVQTDHVAVIPVLLEGTQRPEIGINNWLSSAFFCTSESHK